MYKKNAQGFLKHMDFMVLDLICLHVAFLLAYIVRNGFENPYQEYVYRNMTVCMTLFSILVGVFQETYKNILKRGYAQELFMTLQHTVLVVLFSVFFLFVVKDSGAVSRLILFMTGGIFAVLSYGVHVFWKKVVKRRPFGKPQKSLLIISTVSEAAQAVKEITANSYEFYHMAGIILVDAKEDCIGTMIDGVKVVANKERAVEYICREWVDEVFIVLMKEHPYSIELMDQLAQMGIVTHWKLSDSKADFGSKQFVEKFGGCTVLTTSLNVATPAQLFTKRFIDILGALAGCFITLCLTIVFGPIIYFKSPGPIFFTQTRVGKNGKKFKLYKFRSMYLDAEERKKEYMAQNQIKDPRMFKLECDPRIIGFKQLPDGTVKKGIGNFIRDFSIDEFPQFFNVLKGDMSLVGTRPPTVDEWEIYKLHHRARLAIKPGLTGLWQVSGRSNITDFDEVVKLDTKYINEWNIGLDLRILLKTVKVVVGKEGAR